MRLAVVAALLSVALPAIADEVKYEYKDVTAPVPPPPPKWSWKANMSLGLVWVAGNAQSLGLSGTGLLSARRGNNEWAIVGGGAYVLSGVSSFGKGGPVDTTVTSAANWFVKGRYDRYLSERNAIYVSMQGSGDRPSGFIYRLEPQVGYARLFMKSARQLLRGEVGFDYTFEHRVLQFDTMTMMFAQRDFNYYSARVYLYYENKFTQYAAFTEGIEMLEAFNHPESFRLNSITTLSSAIYKNVSLKLNFNLRFNNDPPLRPAPEINPATMMPTTVYTADWTHFQKVDTQLDIVVAVTFL
jgi:putative salt-induced outer membrane protein YdiY